MSAEASLGQDRLQADAAGEDQDDPVPMGLAVLAEPAEELVHRLPPLGSDAVVSPLEQPVDEDRQLVDGEHDRAVVLGEGREDLVPLLPPVPVVDPGAELDPHLMRGHSLQTGAYLYLG